MARIAAPNGADKDALHILPLSQIPLETQALRDTRLIKNTHLEGVVELFNENGSGSGQIQPHDLRLVFDMSGTGRQDIGIIRSLCDLPSFDVYSLRINLRKLGIAVEDHDSLKLSDAKAGQLEDHMRVFTRPLITTIYGSSEAQAHSLRDIVALFATPDIEVARKNLRRLSTTLNVDIGQIPGFLEDYGDVYLSLAYYQFCLEENAPRLKRFLAEMQELKSHPRFQSDASFHRSCALVEEKLMLVFREVNDVLDTFRTRTADLWKDLSHERFREMEQLVLAHQTQIGGALCAITVKLNAWNVSFPSPTTGNATARADFILRDMQQGLEYIEPIGPVDPAPAVAATARSESADYEEI